MECSECMAQGKKTAIMLCSNTIYCKAQRGDLPNKCKCGIVECSKHRLYANDCWNKKHIREQFLGVEKYYNSCSKCRSAML